MRYFFIGIIIMLSFTLIGTGSALAKEAKNEGEFMGVVYGEKIFALDSKDQLDAKLEINKLETKNDSLDVDLTLSYGGNEFDLETSGKVYSSSNTYTGGYLVDLNETEDYIILSFKVEEEAKQALLLPINYDLTNKTVVKIAMFDKNTDDLIYFEDTLSNAQQIDDIKEISQELTLGNFDDQQAFNEQKEKNHYMESWYTPFLEPVGEKDITEEEAKQAEPFVLSDDDNNIPPLIPSGYFQLEGERLSTYADAGGFYIVTNEYPAGSNNLLSHAFQWSWVHNAPDTFDSNDKQESFSTSLELTHQGQFSYNKDTRKLTMVHTTPDYRIKNPTISGGVTNKNTEIFSEVTRKADFSDRNVTFNLKGFLGLTPIGQNYFFKMLSLIDFVEDKQTSGTVILHDSIANQEAIWGDAVRAYAYQLEDEFFIETGDKLAIATLVQIPTDAGWERVPGERKMEYNFKFDIYKKSFWGIGYTDLVEEVDQTFYETYEVME